MLLKLMPSNNKILFISSIFSIITDNSLNKLIQVYEEQKYTLIKLFIRYIYTKERKRYYKVHQNI